MRLTRAEEMALRELPRDAQSAAIELLTKLPNHQKHTLMNVLTAARRHDQRRESDRATDTARRLTIGARLPREVAERYRAAARAAGLSLYSWVWGACEERYRRESGQWTPKN